jgi:hypothetical protein
MMWMEDSIEEKNASFYHIYSIYMAIVTHLRRDRPSINSKSYI